MPELASLSESSRQSALQRFQLLRAQPMAGRLLRLLVILSQLFCLVSEAKSIREIASFF
jgi:hypothetical protein